MCKTYSNSGADHFFATAAAALADCTSCADSGESMIISAVGDTKGSCVLTTAPCDANTKYILKVTATNAAITTFCGTNKCGTCTAKATSGTVTDCATLAFSATDYSFESDPADRCATCTDSSGKSVLMTSATGTFGTCTANTATCADISTGLPSAKVYKAG